MRRRHLLLGLVLLLFALYAGWFIFQSSFVFKGIRHFCLFDDAMISMRYARNLAHGYGAVWNPGGPRVEGYTNPLWMLYMAAIHLLPISPAKASLPLQLTAAVLLAIDLLLVYRIAWAISAGSTSSWMGAVLLTAFYLPLNTWALIGMEVGLAALLVAGIVCTALRCIDIHRFSLGLYALTALALLTRIDLLVPCAIIWGCLVMFEPRHRRRHLWAGVLALAGTLAAETVWRLAYYGDVLPNTYYLKMTGYPAGLRMIRGLRVLWDFVGHMNPFLFLLPVALLWLQRDRRIVLLMCVLFGQLAYSVYVGGDAWEWWGGANRYIAIAMPLFFVLFCCTLDQLSRRAMPLLDPQCSLRGRVARACCVGFLLLGAMLNFNALKGPASLRQWFLLEPPPLIRDNPKMVRQAYLLREISRPGAKIALVWAGIMPYFADRQMIDISGKNDRYVARLPMHTTNGPRRYSHFLPGHLKWDYGYCIGRLKPDVVLQVDYPPGEADEFLRHTYQTWQAGPFRFHLRKHSPNLRWDRTEDAHLVLEITPHEPTQVPVSPRSPSSS